jgi:tetratricopeptide (TPR) repeat protein
MIPKCITISEIVTIKQEKNDQAMEEYQITIELDPNDAKAHHNLGVCYAKQGKTDLARSKHSRKRLNSILIMPRHITTSEIVTTSKRKMIRQWKKYQIAIELNPISFPPI